MNCILSVFYADFVGIMGQASTITIMENIPWLLLHPTHGFYHPWMADIHEWDATYPGTYMKTCCVGIRKITPCASPKGDATDYNNA